MVQGVVSVTPSTRARGRTKGGGEGGEMRGLQTGGRGGGGVTRRMT